VQRPTILITIVVINLPDGGVPPAVAPNGADETVGATLVVALFADADDGAHWVDRAGTSPAPTVPTLGDVIGAFKSITTHEYMAGVRVGVAQSQDPVVAQNRYDS